MIADLWTVMWKEWKELFVQRGSMRGGLLRLVIVIGVLGIVPPLQAGREWVDSPMVLAFAGWMPLLLVTSVVADSFAGERERHTLETLLASRLPDRAILFGKVGTAVSYGWGLTMVRTPWEKGMSAMARAGPKSSCKRSLSWSVVSLARSRQ